MHVKSGVIWRIPNDGICPLGSPTSSIRSRAEETECAGGTAMLIRSIALGVVLSLSTDANAAVTPVMRDRADSPVVLVAMGCGPGWTRGPYGGCHPIGLTSSSGSATTNKKGGTVSPKTKGHN